MRKLLVGVAVIGVTISGIAATPLASAAEPVVAATPSSAGPSCTATVANGTAQCVQTYICPADRCTIAASANAKARLFLKNGTASVTSAAATSTRTCTPKFGTKACSAATDAISLTSGQSAEVRCTTVPQLAGFGGGTVACSSTVTEKYLVHLHATLTGTNMVPIVGTTGIGTAEVTVDTETGEICYTVTARGLSMPRTITTIHRGPAGINGPTIQLPFSTAESFCGTATPQPGQPNAQELAVNPSGYYIVLHTQSRPAGEIRGQLNFAN